MLEDARTLAPSAVTIPNPELHEATILDEATEPGQRVRCIVPGFDPLLAEDPMEWQPYITSAGTFYPKKGDRALVSRQPDGVPAIVWWKPSTPRIEVTKEAPINIGHPEYGAKSDGSDNKEALKKAFEKIPTAGGEILVPFGEYRFSELPTLEKRRGIIIGGMSGPSAGAATGSILTYTGTTDGAWNCRSISGITFRDLMFLHTGDLTSKGLFDFSHAGAEGADAAYITFERCYIGGSGTSTCGKLVNLDKTIIADFIDTVFGACQVAVQGKAEAGSYSNAVGFRGATFTNQIVVMPIRNPGESWNLFGGTANGLSNHKAGLVDQVSGAEGDSLGIFGLRAECLAGEAGNWINYSGVGLAIAGGQYANGAIGVKLGASGNAMSGVSILGTRFVGQTTAGASIVAPGAGKHSNFVMVGNPGLTVQYGALPINSLIQAGTTESIYSLGTMPLVAGVVSDASFPAAPADGTMAYDKTNNKLYMRNGGAWKSVLLT